MSFEDLNLTELDRDLSEEQQKEWNAIYASYRAGSVLTGRIAGMDTTSLKVKNKDTGKTEIQEINCLVVISYRVKVLIPEQDIWLNEKTQRPTHVLRSMTGAIIDYVITGIDREGECCVASRRLALGIRKRNFLKLPPKDNKKIQLNILAVGKVHLLATVGGFDMTLSQRDLSYGMLADLRDKYHPGDTVTAVVKDYDEENEKLTVSVKDAEPHPFIGADMRHPVGSRRASFISGKYKGGVFCKLEENLDCLCIYSPSQYDIDFEVGDQVIVVITKYNYTKKQIYGKIVAKW